MKSLLPLALTLFLALTALAPAADHKPHAVFVVGTPHYNPAATMPPLAKQLEKFGFTTTVVSPEWNPEKNERGIPGLEALNDADVAIFFLRFLTLPEDQVAIIEKYLHSGKPVVGIRTSTHAFSYPKDHPLARLNNGFGKEAMGTQYFIHSSGPTEVAIAKGAAKHEILTGYDTSNPLAAGGTLYLSDLPNDATVLLTGTAEFNKTGTVTNGFGTVELAKIMTDDIAWTWTNQWGGRVFGTTLGHVDTFANANFVRLFINGIHWAAGKPVPPAGAEITALDAGLEKHATPHAASAPKAARAPAGATAKPETSAPSKADSKAAAKKARADKKKKEGGNPLAKEDAKNRTTGKPEPPQDPELEKFAIFEQSAPHPNRGKPVATTFPLEIAKGARIVYIGNTLLDRAGEYGYFETLLHQRFPNHHLEIRNLSWSADEVDLQPRPDNFGTLDQHLTVQKADLIFAAFGFNESFGGRTNITPATTGPEKADEAALAEFRDRLTAFLKRIKISAFNGKSGPHIVLVSPTANEDVAGVPAAKMNDARLEAYTKVMSEVAAQQKVGFANVFDATREAMADPKTDLTFNGVHMLDEGYRVFSNALFRKVFNEEVPPKINEAIRETVVDKNRQFFHRYRPLNTFYYTGGRNKSYGYLDFLPAMRNFDIMTSNRDKRIWDLAQGKNSAGPIDDSNVPPLPQTIEARGANEWLSPADELAAFKIDPRFEVNLFASEEEFPEIACPIQLRWDTRGRLWVSCSTTYPHLYPGNAPADKIVILEDTDWDGKADKSTVFADDLEVPLSFEFGDGGVYVSEEPHFTFIKDTDGDGKADFKRNLLTGFGCEDSHHALHDFIWTPGGDLLFRESIFHNSQVETPYGPIRAKNSAWFQFQPRDQRLISFGAYPNTNPWGVTFDDWGHHVASHPIFASAFHALNPPYPEQHPQAVGIPAYSGVCGHEFVDFASWPEEMQGGFVKVRYKPTNRVEIHQWVEHDDHFAEEYQTDLIFSTNLSFIPVDLKYGPRGAMYICDWYNPVKGHAQYSLRDERRDRKSGRIWRITPMGATLQDPVKIAGEPIPALLDNLKRPEMRIRYWTRYELRERDPKAVEKALDRWVAALDPNDPRYRHHQVEAMWAFSNIGAVHADLLNELLECDEHHARAAATRQIRHWFPHLDNPEALLFARANDDNGIVRLEAANAASWVGTPGALDAVLETLDQPMEDHLKYAVRCALGSENLSRLWKDNDSFMTSHPELASFVSGWETHAKITAGITTRSADQAQFDSQKNLKVVEISCIPERILYDVTRFEAEPGQPVKLVLTNPDATQHNLVIVEPGAMEEIGMAGNEMAKDPNGIKKDFIPESDKILHKTKLLNPNTGEVLRFHAPDEPGEYPYLCTFPGHWIIMNGVMVVR